CARRGGWLLRNWYFDVW
nr:immunoglobulin heavy chain junction region [Mus musculus]MBK4189056.1 immunoglobulin heavy chain junction region [Mus musculus]MBK4189058.1 immunoglobulin heavy chain junction region [Mus musculus]